MYSKTRIQVTFFQNDSKENTENCIFGRISERVKNGNVYAYEQWDARFVGNAYSLAKELENGKRITILECSYHNPYSKESKRPYPRIDIFDFEECD